MTKKILMLAAEHGYFEGAKVGGVGDVIRDLPQALVKQGCSVTVAIPSYGFLTRTPHARKAGVIAVEFAGETLQVELFELKNITKGEHVLIFHHEKFFPNGESVYCDDPDWRPFATDATKFALFGAAVASALCQKAISEPDVVHCHDWHTGFFIMLARKHSEYKQIAHLHIVFTIHNLAMQGVRPVSNDESSLYTWFGHGITDLRDALDPEYARCINPMRAGVTLSDIVHTVSPTYAKEVLAPSDHSIGLFGGERLEKDLQKKYVTGKLVGILNGCNYTQKKMRKPAKATLINAALVAQEQWMSQEKYVRSAFVLAEKRMRVWLANKSTQFVTTSVGRITEQKLRVLFTEVSPGKPAIDCILDNLKGEGVFVLLGSGAKHYEQLLTKMMGKHPHFIFLNGYNELLSHYLYSYGDCFLMPSSFEPCGISQLLAMRAGQPCLVSDVGGLKDTVMHLKTGFVFGGKDDIEKANNLCVLFCEALKLFKTNGAAYKAIGVAAKAERFSWESVAKEYCDQLYV